MAKFYRLLTDNQLFYAGESVFSEKLKNRLLGSLPAHEASVQKFEEVSQEEAYKNGGYYLITTGDFIGNYGERNVFHDVCGREYHN